MAEEKSLHRMPVADSGCSRWLSIAEIGLPQSICFAGRGGMATNLNEQSEFIFVSPFRRGALESPQGRDLFQACLWQHHRTFGAITSAKPTLLLAQRATTKSKTNKIIINNLILKTNRMKKVFATLTVLAMLTIGSVAVMAQEAAEAAAPVAEEQVTETPAPAVEAEEVTEEADGGIVALHKTLKTKFIEGGAGFMAATLLCLVFGLALCIERIIYLSLSKTNTKALLAEVEAALKNGGIEAALEVCRNTRGPVASIFYQGLSRYSEGVDVVEKTVASYGGVQLGLLEKNLSWISLFISIAPSLGFLGTIIGMIQAFDKIQQVGDISATVVAGGIKVALLTTLLGLIIAIILQVFYNYILSLIEGLVNEMEDSSISLLDLVVEYDAAQKK